LRTELLKKTDISSVSKLVERSFVDSVASTLSVEGIETFKLGLTPESIRIRLDSGNLFVVCRVREIIVGLGEVRDGNHLNLLFVDPKNQRKGVGRKIFEELLHYIDEREITENSSLNSVGAYKRFGFTELGSPCQVRGIKYQAMLYSIIEKT